MRRVMNTGLTSPKNQSGVVLVIGLIMLMLLTLIGVSGLQATGLEEKMAGNLRDSNMAFQAAESALVEAEGLVATTKPAITCPGTNLTGYYKKDDYDCDNNATEGDADIPWKAVNWSGSPVKTVEYAGTLNHGTDYKLNAKPRYIVEYMGDVCRDASGAIVLVVGCPSPNTNYKSYRLTARASGGSDSSVVTLQSVYEVPS